MKLRILLLCAVLLPTLAVAEVYKWKDKNGVVRYSDVPPPSNVKQETMYGKKIPKPTGLAPLAAVEGDATAAANRDKASTIAKDKVLNEKAGADKTKAVDGKFKEEKATPSKEEAALKRAKDAEQQKMAEEQKKAELETKQANCNAARQNLATFTNGGRISKTDENGKKEYLSDADIGQGKADAQRDVEKYCE
jgi:hypothetical protein